MRSAGISWGLFVGAITIEHVNALLGTVSLCAAIAYTGRLLWVSFKAKK